VEHGPRKNPVDFGGNPDHVTLRSGRVTVGPERLCLFISDSFMTSAPLWEVRTLQSAVLDDYYYFSPRSTQPSIPPGSVNEYQLRLGRQRVIWLIPLADETQRMQVP